MNPMEMLKNFMTKGGTPEQLILSMLGNNVNPMFNNLMNMAKQGDNKSVENIARNMCKEKGVDFDKEFNTFMQNVKNLK